MGTTAAAQDMTALLGFPQARAATAGPATPVPVAFLGRTSNERLQDPIASMRRQVRKSHAWLPAGCQIVACYWDVESGGDDLEDRGRKDTWQVAAAAGIPRDGGISDLLNEAKSPTPDFAFVICENIERSARDTYNSLKLERELQDQGIPLFATDEPFSVEGINATTILVRRVKQGVAEWFRLQLKDAVLVRAERTLPGRVEPRQSPHRLHRGTPPAPQPDQGRRRAQQNPAGPRPRLRAGHRPDLPVAGTRTARQAHHPRPAGRRPAPVPAARPRRVVTGPGR